MKNLFVILICLSGFQLYSQSCSVANINFINSDTAFEHNLYNCAQKNSSQAGIDSCMTALYRNIPAACLVCYLNNLSSCGYLNCMMQCSSGSYGTACQTCLKAHCGTEITACIKPGLSLPEKPGLSCNIFPVPAGDKITIELTGLPDAKNSLLSVFDLQGKLLLTVTLTQDKNEININELASGVYVLKISNDNFTTIINKFVKE